MEGKEIKIWPMTRDQSFVAAAVFVSFFVLWFLWAAAGDRFICWIGGKDNLSGWVQAIGSIAAILVTAYIARKDSVERDREKNIELQKELKKIKFYLGERKFLNSFLNYEYRYKRVEKDYFGNNEHIKKYKNIYVFILTKKYINQAFLELSELSDDDRFLFYTCCLGEDFSKIFRAIIFINQTYNDIFDIWQRKYNYNSEESAKIFIEKNNKEEIFEENKNLEDDIKFINEALSDFQNVYKRIYNYLN